MGRARRILRPVVAVGVFLVVMTLTVWGFLGTGPRTAGPGDADVRVNTEAASVNTEATSVNTEATDASDESDAEVVLKESVGFFAAADELAGKFIDAGGEHLCEAWYYALSPELDSRQCPRSEDPERCMRQYTPVRRDVEKFCQAVLADSALYRLDPGMVVSIAEKESSGGRLYFDSEAHVYRITADVCETHLAASRILARRGPGRRPGTTHLRWAFGENGVDERDVRIVEEDESGITINTCVADEAGRFQLLPNNYRRGTVVTSTGERLTGNDEARRERVLRDPELDAHLGCQQLARHRDVCPEEQRADWWTWISAYNTGKCESTRYALNVARVYLRACKDGWMIVGADPVPWPIDRLWNECAHVRDWYRSQTSTDDGDADAAGAQESTPSENP